MGPSTTYWASSLSPAVHRLHHPQQQLLAELTDRETLSSSYGSTIRGSPDLLADYRWEENVNKQSQRTQSLELLKNNRKTYDGELPVMTL
jgi:hypothetical protein